MNRGKEIDDAIPSGPAISRRKLLYSTALLPVLNLKADLDQTAANPTIREVWSMESDIVTHPVTNGDLVYGITSEGVLIAKTAESGTNAWRATLGNAPYPSAVAVFGDIIFAGDSSGRCVALNTSSGDRLWDRTLNGPVLGFAENGESVIATHGTGIQSLSMSEGRVNWQYEVDMYNTENPMKVGAIPTVYGNAVFFRISGGGVAAVSTTDGSLIWENELENPLPSYTNPTAGGGIAIAVGHVFVGTSSLTALNIQSGEVAWTNELNSDHHSSVSPVTDGELVFAGTNAVYAFDTETGERVWTVGSNPSPGDALTYHSATDTLFASVQDGDSRLLIALDPDVGTEKWRELAVDDANTNADRWLTNVSTVTHSNAGIHAVCDGLLFTLRSTDQLITTETATPTSPSNSDTRTDSNPSVNTASAADSGETQATPVDENYRGLISNNPDTDVGSQYSDIYVLTILSTVLSLVMIVGQVLRRGRD